MSWNDHVGPDWDTLRLTNLAPLLDQDTEALSSATFQDCVSVHWEHRWSQRPDDAHCPRLDNAHCPWFPNSQESFDSYVLICLRMILALPRQENGFSARESKPEGIRSEFGGTQVSTRKWVQTSLLKMSSHDLMCVQTVEVCADSDCRTGWGARLHLSTHISDEHCAAVHPRAAVFSGCQSALVDEVEEPQCRAKHWTVGAVTWVFQKGHAPIHIWREEAEVFPAWVFALHFAVTIHVWVCEPHLDWEEEGRRLHHQYGNCPPEGPAVFPHGCSVT